MGLRSLLARCVTTVPAANSIVLLVMIVHRFFPAKKASRQAGRLLKAQRVGCQTKSRMLEESVRNDLSS